MLENLRLVEGQINLLVCNDLELLVGVRILIIELFGSTQILLLDIVENGPNQELRGEADTYLDAISSFDFVFVMLLLNKVMGLTDYLCQVFQKKSLDIVRALNFV